MEFRDKQIAPPKNWTTFEDLCLALFREEWNDKLALKNGRTGQPQHGVDVYGSPQSERSMFYGVQCKGKDRNYGSTATVKELDVELLKAEKFKPGLKHWIFATSANKDVKLQEHARCLSETRRNNGHFSVTVLGWEDIQSLLAIHPSVIEQFYPEHAFDISATMKALRELPSGAEISALREEIRRLNDGSNPTIASSKDAQWDSVTFSGQRDLGPALLGYGLGPADAKACPRLDETDLLVAQLRRGFSARLIGGPGCGKSVCAFQAAGDFASEGRRVYRLRDSSAFDDPTALPPDDLSLLIIDDAHLLSPSILKTVEAAADMRHFIISVHNGVGSGPVSRGAISIDAKRAVKAIATGLLADPEKTLDAVRRADSDVGIDFLEVSLEQRIDDARSGAETPWQFCSVLGGGWKRAKSAADSARFAGFDLVLAAAAINQLASRDAQLSPTRLNEFCKQNGVLQDNGFKAIEWLASQRFLLSEMDCRCPHQRFALVVLGKILESQDQNGRAAIGTMLCSIVQDSRYPISGIRILLHELRFLGDFRRWTRLVEVKALEPLIARCWSAASAEDRMFAAFLFSDLDAYIDDWHERIYNRHTLTIAEWISTAVPPTAYGLFRLLNNLRNDNPQTAAVILEAVSPKHIAQTLAGVTPETADHCASLIDTIGWKRPVAWQASFNRVFDRIAPIKLAQTWPTTAPLHSFANFCKAINSWDDELGLEMVGAFVPVAQKALAEHTVSAFRLLDDIFGQVLRLSDPLGVYVGKLAPNKRRRLLAKAICATLKPQKLSAQLSATPRRNFQDATFFLAFLRKANNSKFKATVEAIEWSYIANTIGERWTNLPHEAEILLSVCYSNERARTSIREVVKQNLYRIEMFSPRLAVMMPEIAILHVESGKQIRLGQHGHFEFEYSAILIDRVAELRPELIEPIITPYEPVVAVALSQQNSSWFTDASLFIEVVSVKAPESLQRILSAIDSSKAELGWTDSLKKSCGAREAVASLIESALPRADSIGDLANKLRKRYRSWSVPKKVNLSDPTLTK